MAEKNITENQSFLDSTLPKVLNLEKCFGEEPRELDFVLPGLLAGTVGALVGTGGTSKSSFMLQVALMLAGGPDTLDLQKIDKNWKKKEIDRVCYIAAEDPQPILQRRSHSLGALMSPEARGMVRCALEIHCANGFLLDITEHRWNQWLFDIAKGTRLVIIDTLRRVHQLDENESGAMSRLVGVLENVCKETGTTILYVHHTNKGGAQSGEATSTRGSSVLTDNARLQLNLVTMNDAEAKENGIDENHRKRYVRLVYAKTNYCAPYADTWYKRCAEGRLEPIEFIKPMSKGKGGRASATY